VNSTWLISVICVNKTKMKIRKKNNDFVNGNENMNDKMPKTKTKLKQKNVKRQ